MKCKVCGKKIQWFSVPVCVECSKREEVRGIAAELHENISIIEGGEGYKCKLCMNRCGITKTSLCGLRYVEAGHLKSRTTEDHAVLEYYYDPLPTNCCNSFFCEGSRLSGYNLALFYYGCSFDCLYCQNWMHKNIEGAKTVSLKEVLEKATDEKVRCICHFGGSPEPQINFALRLSSEVLKIRDVMICWEWNGSAREDLALKAAELSHSSKGTVKFDIKAWNENLHLLLTGRLPYQSRKNFTLIFEKYPEVLSATTLLVPYFVDEEEVKNIAKFISEHSDNIPYILLVFHPDYKMIDFPVTSRDQVLRCLEVARKYLKRVYVGNMFLL